jgi:glycosyltransferase involved in cell wall biosynthesis
VIRGVRATRKHAYVYADHYLETGIGSRLTGNETPVDVEAGDLYLGLDLTSRISPSRQGDFLRWHARGVRFAFVVYDMLPRLHPQWFTPRGVDSFERWLTMLAIHADALFCISATVAAETTRQTHFAHIPATWFHLGADLAGKRHAVAADASKHDVESHIVPRILMVGTIEPRKGHRLILDAFEQLWRNGSPATLVIVGRAGWAMETVTERLTNHAELGRRLEWRRDADDETLAQLYATCDGLILASEGEGFGLPIIEASSHGLPLLLRDLPVFREVAGPHADYFAAQTATDLAPRLQAWFDAILARRTPDSLSIKALSWQDSAHQLKALIAQFDAAS